MDIFVQISKKSVLHNKLSLQPPTFSRTSAPQIENYEFQGTVLRPVLFNIVYNALQLPETISESLSKYADDGIVLIPVDEHVKETIEEKVQHINNWCERNNFLLNVNKTKFMMFYHGRPDDIDIGKQMESSLKILSVTFDPQLNFASHIESVRNRASQNLYLLYKLKYLGYEKKRTGTTIQVSGSVCFDLLLERLRWRESSTIEQVGQFSEKSCAFGYLRGFQNDEDHSTRKRCLFSREDLNPVFCTRAVKNSFQSALVLRKRHSAKDSCQHRWLLLETIDGFFQTDFSKLMRNFSAAFFPTFHFVYVN